MPSTLRALPCLVVGFALFAAWPSFMLADDVQWNEGDRVVLLGGTVIEREQQTGYWETNWTRHAPGVNVIFRNLGWSADTVWAEARAGFETPEWGFNELQKQLEGIKPTRILVHYGANESFDGGAGLQRFRAGLERLDKMLRDTGAQLIYVQPFPVEAVSSPLPSVVRRNQEIDLYRDPIRTVARENGSLLIDLTHELDWLFPGGGPQPRKKSHDSSLEFFLGPIRQREQYPLTTNGMHFSPLGYWRTAALWEKAFGWKPFEASVRVNVGQKQAEASGGELSDVVFDQTNLQFTLRLEKLPAPTPPVESGPVDPMDAIVLQVDGLSEGEHELFVDGQSLAVADASAWKDGVRLTRGPDVDQVEQLRQTIIRKNELYFHHWRPQNITYLTGIRAHEQGNNAKEIEQFIPLVHQQEAKIAELRKPQPHRYELRRVSAL